jgi:hypothetical protein
MDALNESFINSGVDSLWDKNELIGACCFRQTL